MMSQTEQTDGGHRRFLLALDAIMRGIDADEVRFNYDASALPIVVQLSPPRPANGNGDHSQHRC